MPGDTDHVRRWAAVHAATMITPVASRVAAVTRPEVTPSLAVLSSFVHVDEIDTGFWVNAVAWATHSDGRLLLAAAGDPPGGTVGVWAFNSGSPVQIQTWNVGVRGAEFGTLGHVAWGHGPDGRLLLAGASSNGRVSVWDLDSGQLVHVIEGNPVTRVSWAAESVAWGRQPDGRLLLAAATAGNATAWVWDPGAGRPARRVPGYAGNACTVAWVRQPDGRLALALGETSGTVQIVDPDTGQGLRTLTRRHESVTTVARAQGPDGRQLLAIVSSSESSNGEAGVWDQAADQFAELATTPSMPLKTAAWGQTGDGRLLLALASRNELWLWDCHGQPRLLCSQRLTHQTGGFGNLDCAVDPAGRLLLAVGLRDRKVQVWEAVLDPPVQPSATSPPGRVIVDDHPAVRVRRRGKLVQPPQDVTPVFQDGHPGGATSISCTAGPDGHVLVAARSAGGSLRVWDATAGTLLDVVDTASAGFAWGHLRDGRLRLAIANEGSPIRFWDPGTRQLAESLRAAPVDTIIPGWVHDGERLLLAIEAKHSVRAVTLWDPDTGEPIRSLSMNPSPYNSPYNEVVVAQGRLFDGRRCLVTGRWGAATRVWDLDTGGMIRQLPDAARLTGGYGRAAWITGVDGRPELAIGTPGGAIRTWDPETGTELRTLIRHGAEVLDLLLVDEPGWPPVLASAARDETVRIWDPHTGAELARLPMTRVGQDTPAIGAALVPGDGLMLVVAAGPDSPGPVRVYRIAADDSAPTRPGGGASLTTRRADELAGWLLRLGGGGLWPPLGLVADLVALTGPESDARQSTSDGRQPTSDARQSTAALSASRLAALADAPGITLLRRLGWPSAARVAFIALLASALDIPAQYLPPGAGAGAGASASAGPGTADPPSGTLRKALIAALTGGVDGGVDGGGTSVPSPVPVAALRAAAAAIIDPAITLLAILGPDACAADPLLPLRLAHHLPQLPALSPQELRALAAAGIGPAEETSATAGTTSWSPGTAGIIRDGPLTRLLPTELALPSDLLTIRLVEGQLLYRQHRTPAPPAPEPVTVILDTTPPTFGPAGTALRLAAHLLTITLWEHGRHPALITLTAPGVVTELRAPADLIKIWTSATLDHSREALTMARRTAAGLGQPAVLCTHFQVARDHGYPAGPGTRLLTAHQPPDKPPPDPVSPWHAHVPPAPASTQLTTAISRLLTG